MMAHLKLYLDPLSPHQLKKVITFIPPMTKLSGSAHGVTKVNKMSLILFSSSAEVEHEKHFMIFGPDLNLGWANMIVVDHMT